MDKVFTRNKRSHFFYLTLPGTQYQSLNQQTQQNKICMCCICIFSPRISLFCFSIFTVTGVLKTYEKMFVVFPLKIKITIEAPPQFYPRVSVSKCFYLHVHLSTYLSKVNSMHDVNFYFYVISFLLLLYTFLYIPEDSCVLCQDFLVCSLSSGKLQKPRVSQALTWRLCFVIHYDTLAREGFQNSSPLLGHYLSIPSAQF